MNISLVSKTLGILLIFFSLIMIPPAVVSLLYNDGEIRTFLESFFAILAVGACLFLPFFRKGGELKPRNGFLVVVMAWFTLAMFGALPFLISSQTALSPTDAVFESFSGLTTTGATTLTGLDQLPASILFYRQFTQWLGGIGIILLAIAVLPLLGVGGMQLYRAEAAGPVKDNKLAPRITETAKYLFYIYFVITVACAFFYWLAGMSVFDAICHAFSTTSIGGFSTYDANLAFFDNIYIELVAAIFMLISAVNFGLHFSVWKRRGPYLYFRDAEFLFFFSVIFVFIVLACVALLATGTYESPVDALRYGSFHTISIITTTGFFSDDFSQWASAVPITLFLAGFMGGCAGSTGSGIKAIRLLLLYKQFVRELYRLIHPNAVFAIKYGKSVISDRLIQAIWGFIGAYIVVFSTFVFLLMFTGLDFETAFSAVAASINNLGPGLGSVAKNYAELSDPVKWLLCLVMLLGRIEVLTLLVLFSPVFWRK